MKAGKVVILADGRQEKAGLRRVCLDAEGRLRDWWTAEDASRFAAMTKRLGEAHSTIEPLPGVQVNGGLVVDEAIDDLAAASLRSDTTRHRSSG
ncbi:MAG: M13-type metalloendopeptidase [Gemmatimonadota bacterium]